MNALSHAVDQLEAILRKKEQRFHRAINVKLIPHPVMEPGGLILHDLHEAVRVVEENAELKEVIKDRQESLQEIVEIIGSVQSDLTKAVKYLEACLEVRPVSMDTLRSKIKKAAALLEASSEDLGSVEAYDE